MKLDLLYEIDAPRPWDAGQHPDGQRAREQRAYYEMLDQVKLADQLGFNVAWFVEHHFREGRSHCPAPEVVLGALTQATENLRLGFGVTLLPYGFTHPARVAEKVATADILSKGRVVKEGRHMLPSELDQCRLPPASLPRQIDRASLEICVHLVLR